MVQSQNHRRFPRLFISATFIFWCIVLVLYLSPSRLSSTLHTPAGHAVPDCPPHQPNIPEKIWYKVGPEGYDSQAQERLESCLRKNPSHTSEVMTDAAGERFLRKHFRSRPDIIDTYFALPSTTHKADFLRYLVLFAEGGVWFDRISCENTPIRDWIPKGFKDVVNLVVGLEADMGLNDDARQFAPWAIMAAPKSPHVLRFINDIVGAVHGAAKGDKLAGLGDVSGLTGPKRFTRAVLESLEISTNGTVDKNGIAHLLRPLLVGDVAIMPGYSFAASLNTYEAGVGTRLVRHHSN